MSRSSIYTKKRGLAAPRRVTTHPGEALSEEFLNPLGMSANALAMALRVPATRIGAIVKGERSVTADTAAARALLWHQSRILDESAGNARPDQSQIGKRRGDRARRAAVRGVLENLAAFRGDGNLRSRLRMRWSSRGS